MYLLGYDIGSSSIKAALVNADTGAVVDIVKHPESEIEISAPHPHWAEQDPEVWWKNLCLATHELLDDNPVDGSEIKAIGISYQMHGLVIVDKDQNVLRPSIIWCDSRAVAIGENALADIGEEKCFSHLLNGPGNFTASKLRWVKENEPDLFERIHKFMLPGDFIAMKMTGEINTTISGLSEGMMWDFDENTPAEFLLDHYGIDQGLTPPVVPTLGDQGRLTSEAAEELGLEPGIPISYRAGDQPNNAMSLGVLEPGEIAATGGTSGVVYGVVDQNTCDPKSRVNTFAHINHSGESPRLGVLLCINGAGIQYSWIKQQLAVDGTSYREIEKLIAETEIGSDGLRVLPFGNGAERIFGDKNVGSHFINLNFNRHSKSHLYRASLEGIAFAFVYGLDILKKLGLKIDVIKVGNDNLFQSPVFSNTIASLTGVRIEMIETTGAVGAAKASGVAVGVFDSIQEAVGRPQLVEDYDGSNTDDGYQQAYQLWLGDLKKLLS